MSELRTTLNSKALLLMILIFAIFAAAFGLLAAEFLDWREYRHLSMTGIKTVGHVTAKEPENHNFVRYAFQVDNESFSGFGNAGGENPEFEDLKIGAAVTVYYDPENPDHSLLGNPHRQASAATRGVIFTAIVGSFLSLLALYAKGWLPVFKSSES